MNTYKIEFKHVEESTFTAIVEAENYDEAMDIFEESPFDYLENEEPDSVQGLLFNVSEVKENDKIVYHKSRRLIAEYQ